MILAVDLDHTLCKLYQTGEQWQHYATCEPITDHIKIINQLYEDHHITIYTARRKEDEVVTKEWLQNHGVQYHDIIFGKFRADKYLDQDSMKMGEAYATFILGRPRQLHRMALPKEA